VAAIEVSMSKRISKEAKSEKAKAEALALAGAWKDLRWDDLAEKLDKWRHESPPSPPIKP